MRLLHAYTLKFHEFQGSDIPEYAILSHRWESEEVTYQDMRLAAPSMRNRNKKGFYKIRQCCRQALADKLAYVWIDTCCIDKTSSVELSEAINSMYHWYEKSTVCYAYLSDVEPEYYDHDLLLFGGARSRELRRDLEEQLTNSKWWTRGWTLQELIAPREVLFFGKDEYGWCYVGSKRTLIHPIVRKTGIDRDVLHGMSVESCSIAMRMSWASDRQTTRIEDTAYCLLGIFRVNMPLLYGEGPRAFLRLQVRSKL